MYKRHIDVKNKLVFIDSFNHIKLDSTFLPEDILFYAETDNEDWWFERNPFAGREKNEELRYVALKILQEAEQKFVEQQEIQKLQDEQLQTELV